MQYSMLLLYRIMNGYNMAKIRLAMVHVDPLASDVVHELAYLQSSCYPTYVCVHVCLSIIRMTHTVLNGLLRSPPELTYLT